MPLAGSHALSALRMATQIGPASVESLGRRTREKPVQSYRDLMNPLRSKEYITGKKGLPRSERTLTVTPNPGSVPVSPTEGSSSENGSWTQQPIRRTSRNIKPRHQPEEESSPEAQSFKTTLRGSLTPVPVSRALSRTRTSPKLHARVDTSTDRKVLVISGLKPFHWIRFTPQIHVIEEPLSVNELKDSDSLSYKSKKPQAEKRASRIKVHARNSANVPAIIKDDSPQVGLRAAEEHRPGLVRLSLKRKLPDSLLDQASVTTSVPTDTVNEQVDQTDGKENDNQALGSYVKNTGNTSPGTRKLSAIAAGKRPAASPTNNLNDCAEDTVSDTASESSDDIDLSTWELPLAYHEVEKPSEEDCEDAADFVLRSQYKALPDVTAFAAVLAKKVEKRSTTDLYNMVQGATDILRLWQDEYIKLDRITAPHSITQRRPVLGGRVPMEPQIYEDIKESILYDYVYDPRKPPGFQDPVGQKAKSTALSRELRQRRKRKLDFDQSDETPVEPYRTRRHVATSAQPSSQKIEPSASYLAAKSSPHELHGTHVVKRRGRPAKERDVHEETTAMPRTGADRGRGGAHSRSRGRGRIMGKGRSRGLAIRYEEEADATVSEYATADEVSTRTPEDERAASAYIADELGDATSQAFDQARAGPVQPSTTKRSKTVSARSKKPDLKQKGAEASVIADHAASSSILTETAIEGSTNKQEVTSGSKLRKSASKTQLQQADRSATVKVDTNDSGANLPALTSLIPSAAAAPQALSNVSTEKVEQPMSITPKTTTKAPQKRKRTTTISKTVPDGSNTPSTVTNPGSASSAPKGKRRRAVSTNTSYPGRNIFPMQIKPTANESNKPQPADPYMRPDTYHHPPLQLSWPVANDSQPNVGFRHSTGNNPKSLTGTPSQSHASATPANAAGMTGMIESTHDQSMKKQGLKIRVPPRKKMKESLQSMTSSHTVRTNDGQQAQLQIRNANDTTQAPSVDLNQTPAAAQTAAQAASARLTKSLIDHAAKMPQRSETVKTPISDGPHMHNSSEDQASSSGDAATNPAGTANAQKVDKRRLKKPPSQLRSETMTKWWADRKAKKLAEKENLKNLQARSQERMLLAGDASRPSVNPFMLGERPLLAYTPLGHVEGQSSAHMIPSPTAALPPYNRVQSPMQSVFPRAPSDSSLPPPNSYPYSVPQSAIDGRLSSAANVATPSTRDRGYSQLQSPGRPPSPREDRRQSIYARPDHVQPNHPASSPDPFRPPTLPSLSQITDPSYQANGSGFDPIRPRTQVHDSRGQHTYPPPPPQLRPIETHMDRDLRSPRVYPHRTEHIQAYDPPTYQQPHGRHAPPQQYSTFPPTSSTAPQQTPSYYPSRPSLQPSPRTRTFERNPSNMSPGASLEYTRPEEYSNYSHYPAQSPSHGLPQPGSYWPPGPSQAYPPRRHTPPPPLPSHYPSQQPPSHYPSQQSQYQYPPPQSTDRPPFRARSPLDDSYRYPGSYMPRDESRMYTSDYDRDPSGSSGPPIDPELLG